ncbi:kinase-like protein [Aspergillus aurantiobrunneus]
MARIRPRRGNVVMLTSSLCVKYGRRVHLSEASTMRFIAQNTSIPVPRVCCALYIVMARIQGEIIGSSWARRSEQSKAKLLSQLKNMVAKMREIKPPEGTRVASVGGGTVQDFHRHLRGGMEFDVTLDADVRDLMQQQNRSWPLVFTHGDLSSLNILARGEIVGIIDWETAGWYPSYWEYTSAHQVNPQNSFRADEVDKFIQPMPEELEMERARQKHFGDI